MKDKVTPASEIAEETHFVSPYSVAWEDDVQKQALEREREERLKNRPSIKYTGKTTPNKKMPSVSSLGYVAVNKGSKRGRLCRIKDIYARFFDSGRSIKNN
jgi:hypothetical protein